MLGDEKTTEFETLDDALEHIEHLGQRLAELEKPHNPATWPLIIQLDPPISVGKKGEPVSEIRVRQPTLGDLWGIPVNPDLWTFTHILKVAQKITKVGDGQKCIEMSMLKKLPPEQGSLITTAVRVFFLTCL